MKLYPIAKRAISKLENLYHNKLIAYPRVDNNFINKKKFDFFPHPVFRPYNIYMFPFEKTTFIFNKTTSLLFLSIKRIVTPANMLNLSKTIDLFFDDNINFIDKQKEQDFTRILKLYNVFLEENNIKERELIEYSREIFTHNNKDEKIEIYPYKLKNIFFVNTNQKKKLELYRYLSFFLPSKKKTRKKQEEEEKKIQENDNNTECETLTQAIDHFAILVRKKDREKLFSQKRMKNE